MAWHFREYRVEEVREEWRRGAKKGQGAGGQQAEGPCLLWRKGRGGWLPRPMWGLRLLLARFPKLRVRLICLSPPQHPGGPGKGAHWEKEGKLIMT